MPRFMDRTLKRQLPSIKLHVFVDRDWSCKSPLGRLLIACDPDRGCNEVTGVKKSVRKKDLASAKSFSYPEPGRDF